MDIPDDAYSLIPYDPDLKFIKKNRLMMVFSRGRVLIRDKKIHSISPVKKKFRAVGKMYLYAIMDLHDKKEFIYSQTIIKQTLENKEEYLRRVLFYMKHHRSHLEYTDDPEAWLEKIEQLVRDYKWHRTGVGTILKYYEGNLLDNHYKVSRGEIMRKTLVYELTDFGLDVKNLVDEGYVF